MSDPHHDSGGYPPATGAIGAAVQTTSKLVDTIGNPVLLFLIVLTAGVLGLIGYIWHAQREQGIEAYTHIIDICLPNKEKI
jgi:hypothetical protein